MPFAYFFTILETLGAIALILGLLTRLASVWGGVIEFPITGSIGVLSGIPGLAKDLDLFAGALVLLLNRSPLLSIDGFIARRLGK